MGLVTIPGGSAPAGRSNLSGPGSSTVGAVSVWGDTGGEELENSSIIFSAFGETLVEAANAGAARTELGLGTMAVEAAASYQPIDFDLTTIAGLSPTNDDLLQRKGGAWANRTPAQVKTDLLIPVHHTYCFNLTSIGTGGLGAPGNVANNWGVTLKTPATLVAAQFKGVVSAVGAGNPDVTVTIYKNSVSTSGNRAFAHTFSAVAVNTSCVKIWAVGDLLNSGMNVFDGATDYYTVIFNTSASTVTYALAMLELEFVVS